VDKLSTTFRKQTMQVKSLDTYTKADNWFNERKQVRSKAWSIHERPTAPKGTDQRGRLIRHPDGEYYDIMLYTTTMARLFKPEVIDGKRVERRNYLGYASPLSYQFMSDALWLRPVNRVHVKGEKRILPIYTRAMPGSDFSAELTYVDDVLDVVRSCHTRHFRRVSTTEDKARRAEVAKRFEPYIMLAQMRLPEFEASAVLSARSGAPFGGDSSSKHKYSVALPRLFEGNPDPASTNEFFDMCQMVYTTMASKRGYDQPNFSLGSSWSNRTSDPASKLDKPITPDEFRRALLYRINTAMDVDKKSGQEEIPQFVVESGYPHSNVNVWG
jgi:hypothetical protein